ncbi:MAG: hypothetical protein JWO94_3388 [Verrucomicrobiaceae bacterium]|nr:hypothetical protein [Verrucomicrobiaceae bacterium]
MGNTNNNPDTAAAPKGKSRYQSKDELPANLVPHPRFGAKIRKSGFKVDETEIRRSCCAKESETIFPNTVRTADTTKQHNGYNPPRFYYVDILKKCETCRRPFIFHAQEQQYWYEALGFYYASECPNCPECRHADRQLRHSSQRYAITIGRPDLSDGELLTLIEDAVTLFNANILKDQQCLRRLRNLARQRLPDNDVIEMIDQAIAKRKLVSVEPPNQP